jgi:hypothetical protein
MNQDTKIHSEIALAIRGAKKQMFKRHREGMPLRDAAHRFSVDLVKEFHDMIPDHEPILSPEEFQLHLERELEREKEEAQENDREKVLQSLFELLNNKQTPSELWQALAEFVTEQSNKADFYSLPMLTEILKSVSPEDLRGATVETNAKEDAHASN